jgi:sarcosine oxidase subunit delta
MLNIPCPWCGLRSHIEFTYGGDASNARPDDDAPLARWIESAYRRDNTYGLHRELWHHHASCRQWIVVTRDTRTHHIEASAALASRRTRHGE